LGKVYDEPLSAHTLCALGVRFREVDAPKELKENEGAVGLPPPVRA
jgi:hypothetical protein